ncbi:hypothetical protein BS78_04G252000 [Paspalum vaginatum]|nr:hypothetical protein BS78_04G252000 [Paspalum vaginatum]
MDLVGFVYESFAPRVPEVVACKVFDDMPHWDSEVSWDKQVSSGAPIVSMAAGHEWFDATPLVDVIWDDELQDGFKPYALHVARMDEQVQHNPGIFKAPMMSASDVREVFDAILSQILWDDELLQGFESHDS